VVIRRRIKLERVTRNCVRIDREIDEEEEEEEKERGDLVKQSIWEQMKEIVKFTGPAMGMWICGPLMSLIDTVVIGQGSSIELAALGTLFNHTCLSGLVANFEPVDWSPTQ
jgi:Na+-driven multidrug efflux pump